MTADYRITWVDADGNAACIGLDETIRDSDWTPKQAVEAATYRGQCEGIDLNRYHPKVEIVSEDAAHA